jgi:hypothetical protein
MWKILLVALTALCILQAPFLAQAGSYNAQGVFVGTVSSQVSNLFCPKEEQKPGTSQCRCPNGQQELADLADAIAKLLVGSPSLGADVAYYASTSGCPEQQVAAGKGMGKAVAALAASGNSTAADQISAAARLSGNTTIISAAIATSGGWMAAAGVYIPSFTTGTITRFGCTGSGC